MALRLLLIVFSVGLATGVGLGAAGAAFLAVAFAKAAVRSILWG